MLSDSPFRSRRTLEPSPCWISPPSALMSEATSRHLIAGGVGFSKIEVIVLRCFRFISDMVLHGSTIVKISIMHEIEKATQSDCLCHLVIPGGFEPPLPA